MEFESYSLRLETLLKTYKWGALMDAHQNGSKVFICGKGGSAGNANHIANNFSYGISPEKGLGQKCSASFPIISIQKKDATFL